ncbi:DUF6134 family protein [Muricoccus radiodurans]|uniref:DUF6134 family protein n=1 Tax=Muricoccus radiodurans TaxID=2231721 RepID=UPI003CF2BCE8
MTLRTLPRRGLLAAPALLLPLSAGAAPPGGYNWRILRDGREIGTHRVTFGTSGALRHVDVAVDIVVRLAGFTVYRYTHQFWERWDGQRLVGLGSRSDRNGTVTQLVVRPEGDGLIAEGGAAPVRLPRDAAPLSWWDPSTLSRPLFDAKTAAPEARVVHESGTGLAGTWRQPGPSSSEARYAADGTWLGYSTRGEDGSTVTYAAR